MLPDVDHVVYAVPDLADGITTIGRLLGCEAVPGGRHENWGTRNALVSLGEACYLEIIGPDPEATSNENPVLFGIDALKKPRLATWAAKGHDLEATIERASTVGVDLGAVLHGSRQLPDGSVLAWRLTDPFAERLDGCVPFFIDWGDSPRPGATLPRACELLDLTIAHPDAARVESALSAVGAPMDVTAQAKVAITAKILTPDGVVHLT
jgi:hypothetical protein